PHFEKWIDWKNSPNFELYEAQLNRRLYQPSEKKDRFELPASAVTDKVIHALESARPRARYYVTTATYIMGILRRVLSTRMLDWVVKRL
ncbi:MAG: short-chain dehydrogenase, partial [Planktomarina sp.]